MEQKFQEDTNFNNPNNLNDFKRFEAILANRVVCPLKLDVMKHPVILDDEITYEGKKINKWLSRNNTSPSTRAIVTTRLRNRAAEDSDAVINALETEIKSYIYESNKKIEILHRELGDALSEKNKFQVAYYDLKNENTKLHSDLQNTHNIVEKLQNKNQKLKDKCNHLEKDLNYEREMYADRWESSNKQINLYKESLATQKVEIENLKKENLKLARRVENAELQSKESQRQVKEIEIEKDTIAETLRMQIVHTAMSRNAADHFRKEYFDLKRETHPVKFFFESRFSYHDKANKIMEIQDESIEKYRVFHSTSNLTSPDALENYQNYLESSIRLDILKRKEFLEENKKMKELLLTYSREMYQLDKLRVVSSYPQTDNSYAFYIVPYASKAKIEMAKTILNSGTYTKCKEQLENMKNFKVDFSICIDPEHTYFPKYNIPITYYYGNEKNITSWTYADHYANLEKEMIKTSGYVYREEEIRRYNASMNSTGAFKDRMNGSGYAGS